MAIPIYKKFWDFKQNFENDNSENYNYVNEALEFYSELKEIFSKYNDGITFNQYKELAQNPTDAELYFLECTNLEFGKGNLEFGLIPKDLAAGINNTITRSQINKLKEAQEIDGILNYILNQLPKYPSSNPTQTQKVGLLIRSGIIQFLKDNNPGISKNQIAHFFDILTKEPMKQASINSHLKDEVSSPNHPFYTNGARDEIDMQLKKFGISPKAEK